MIMAPRYIIWWNITDLLLYFHLALLSYLPFSFTSVQLHSTRVNVIWTLSSQLQVQIVFNRRPFYDTHIIIFFSHRFFTAVNAKALWWIFKIWLVNCFSMIRWPKKKILMFLIGLLVSLPYYIMEVKWLTSAEEYPLQWYFKVYKFCHLISTSVFKDKL